MKQLSLVAFFLCFSTILGIKCFAKSPYEKSPFMKTCYNTKYCFIYYVKNNLNIESGTIQNCGNAIFESNPVGAKTCDEYGVSFKIIIYIILY